jgi:CubicO group peptidase (beta-lactamase class C family)
MLQGIGLAGAAAGLTGARGTAAVAQPVGADPWARFGRSVEGAFRRMGLVGAGVAVVRADRVAHVQTLGVREVRRPSRPVTTKTGFLVASTTKSMSALLVATYVDEGRFGWDDRVQDVWPAFRAPTPELTAALRVRDLLGMDSGLDEPPALSTLHEGDPTAEQLLQSVVNLPVAAKPHERWIYNNTVYAVGGYLPLLHAGVAPHGLPGTYANAVRERVFTPTGMSARIADDPRGVLADFSRGHGLDITGAVTTLDFGPVGSYAPVGGALASLDAMAAYVQMQLRRGVSNAGRRVVSAANLAECWKPHIPVPISPDLDPDVVSSGYGMGWIHNTFKDGTALVWHNGAIDGFTSYIGFLPDRDLGLVVLNSMNPGPTGTLFYTYVLNLLLNQELGLNEGVPAKVDGLYDAAISALRAQGRQTRPVSRTVLEPYLGIYEGGYQLTRQGSDVLLVLGSRRLPLRALDGGNLVMSGGLLVQQPVNLRLDVDGTPTIEIVGLETVRRTVGP